jgi:hypothetical protein
MGRSKKKKRSNPLSEVHPDWVVTDQIQINGRYVSAGTELSILGERGRFIFIKHVQTPTAEWIDVVGGPERYRAYRSFRSDRVKRVHWKNRTRQNSEG